MAWIKVISESEAEGDLKELYEKYKAPWGGVDNVLKIHSLLPQSLKPHMDLYRTVMFGPSPLSRAQREMIGIVISVTNNCKYCINHQGDALFRLTKKKDLVQQIRSDYRKAPISDQEKLMLRFAIALTKNPQENLEERVKQLETIGFSDEMILHIVLITSYFNFVNRMVQGLGVELEPYWDEEGFSKPELPMTHDP